MSKHLVLSFIAADQPGLVEKVARIVAAENGNWLESRLAHLAGRFAGIVKISVAAANGDALKSKLQSLASEQFQIIIEDELPGSSGTNMHQLQLDIIGSDRPGIVKEIAQALSTRDINVDEMASNITSAPMTAEALFEAKVTISIHENANMDDLQEALDAIANELTLEVNVN
ncbi:MAG: glycine cleavage system protein R [Pseudomonadales bacterium]